MKKSLPDLPWGISAGLLWIAGILMLMRMLIYILIQFPSPDGDDILFSSVALYACKEGAFVTPLFPIDPTGAARYVWHGIGHPWLISILNIRCSNFGQFFALILIMTTTLLFAFVGTRKSMGLRGSLFFSVTVFALQAKVGFRPETTVILLVVLAENFKPRNLLLWLLFFTLIAWVQPTSFIIYAIYSLLTIRQSALRAPTTAIFNSISAVFLINIAICFTYPFPMRDLIRGIWLNSGTYNIYLSESANNWFYGYVRLDSLPLFGLIFMIVYIVEVVRNPLLILISPILWFFGFRINHYYNLVPIFIVLIRANFSNKIEVATPVLKGMVLAVSLFGLAHRNIRDIVSYANYGSTLEEAEQEFAKADWGDNQICEVPGFFTIFLPSSFFRLDKIGVPAACDEKQHLKRIYIVSPKRQNLYGDCSPWSKKVNNIGLGSVFRVDTGYSFAVCKEIKWTLLKNSLDRDVSNPLVLAAC